MNRGLFKVPAAPGMSTTDYGVADVRVADVRVADVRVADVRTVKRLWITVAIDSKGCVSAIMPSIGTAGKNGAIQRSIRLRDRLAARDGERPEMKVEQYNGDDHEFLMGFEHIRVREIFNAQGTRKERAAKLRSAKRAAVENVATEGVGAKRGGTDSAIPPQRQPLRAAWTCGD